MFSHSKNSSMSSWGRRPKDLFFKMAFSRFFVANAPQNDETFDEFSLNTKHELSESIAELID